ncbi:MAG: TonB-dependent receptor plug domain-containing protein, partial [Spirosomataceae bacterium]
MRLSLLQLMMAGLFMVSAHARESSAQDLLKTNVTIRAEKTALQKVLSMIEQQANVRFAYSRSMIQVKQEVSIRAEKQSLDRVLDELFKGTDIDYQVAKGQIILKKRKTSKISSEELPEPDLTVRWIERSIAGRVTENNGEPLPGVSVLLKGTQKGTVTDVDGRFQLDVPSDDAVLVFSFVGYKTEEVVVGNRSNLELTLEIDEKALDEVIVMGYGTMKKRDVLGSVSTVKAEDLQKLNPNSMDAALQGLASGVMVTSSGVPGAPVQVKIRGVNSISSNTDPLWIVDGIPVVTGSIGGEYNGATNQNILSMIDPADIESMQVLKDAAATAIYGSRGSNGVILVTTKSGKTGKSTFDVDFRTGVSNWTKSDIGIASGREFVEIMDLVRQNSRLSGQYEPVQSLGQLDTYQTGMTREEAMNTNTRWADEISRLGSFNDIRISASNGSEKTV